MILSNPELLASLLSVEIALDANKQVAAALLEGEQVGELGPVFPFITPSELENPYESIAARAVRRAFIEWMRDIEEPDGDSLNGAYHIEKYIKIGLGWVWTKPYVKDRQFEWCGAFVAWCLDRLKPEIRRKIMPSTYRMWNAWRKNRDVNRPLSDAQPGDILVVGPSTRKAKRWGHHICLVHSTYELDGDLWANTIEGNAWGISPGDDRLQGVVYQQRQLTGRPDSLSRYVGKFLYRPTEDMYAPA